MAVSRFSRFMTVAFLLLLWLAPALKGQGANPSLVPGAPKGGDDFAQLPYSINLKALAALDPKPLHLRSFNEDVAPFRKGYKVISTGRIFPIVYDVLITPEGPKQETLEAFSTSLDGHSEVLLKAFGTNERLGRHLHYFERFETKGKPDHVSSNYVFLKNHVFYRVIASSWGASMTNLAVWGEVKPDANSEAEVVHLLDAITFK